MRPFTIGVNILAPVAFAALWLSGHFWIGLATLFVAHMLLLAGTLLPNSQLLGPVVTRFRTDKNEVWLTIDDGPDPVDTPALLDLLDLAGAKATFFLIGQKAKTHPGLVADIVSRGHSIGNHTETHPAHTFWRFGPRRLHTEISSGAETLASLGHPSPLFRAPAGMKNPFVHPILSDIGQSLIGWTARGYDGTDTDPNRILSRLVPHLDPGAILLIHEGHETEPEKRLAPEILSRLLREAEAKNIRFVIPDPTTFSPLPA